MNQRILLADDSPTIQKVVELTFMDESFDVHSVGSGDEAIASLERELPHILITDVHMPGPSGYEVCRRAKELRADLPVLLLVGTFEALDEDEADACGADGHLKKPFDSQELLQVVLGLTSGEAAGASAPREVPAAGFDLGAEDSPESGVEIDLAESIDLGIEDGTSPVAAGAPSFDDLLAEEAPVESTDGEPDPGDGDGGDRDVDAGPPEDLFFDGPFGDSSDEEPETGRATFVAADEPPGEQESLARERVTDWELSSSASAASRAATPGPEAVGAPPGAEAAPAEVDGGSDRLSDEDVERVARRVVELLGDDTVRDVAWDVIPDMAEIVIKDRIRALEAEAE